MNIAIITAGGVGTRMEQTTPKQFIEINGKPLIVYTLEKFQQSELIDEIIISCLDGWQNIIQGYIDKYGITKVKRITIGGSTRLESIINGYNSIKEECDDNTNILVHDAIRPNVSQELITRCINMCEEKGNAATYIPCPEVTFFTDDFSSTKEQVERGKLARTQTPQAFKKHLLDKLFSYVEKNNLYNEPAVCALFQKTGDTLYLCEGDIRNIKVTFKSDIDIFEALLKKNA